MTLAAVLLIVVSAIVHAIWNLIGKRHDPSREFFWLANTLGCACLALVMCPRFWIAGRFPADVWALIAATGLFQAIYFTGLAAAYRAGHLSVAYPLIRSAPVIIVALVSVLIGKGYQLTAASIVGMVLIAIGSLVLPIGRFSDWKLTDYLQLSSLFVLLAAIGTSGYSMIDDAALRMLRDPSGVHANRTTLTLVYASMEGFSTSAWLGAFILLRRSKRADPPKPLRHHVGSALVAGIGIFSAYALVLLAMTFAKNVSYIVAFRQLSIPIGALLGITVLREPRSLPKIIGVAIMLSGLALVAIG